MARNGAILATVFLVTTLVAAQKKGSAQPPLHTESQFSFNLVLDDSGNIKQIEVLKNGEQVELLDTCTGGDIPRENGLGELAREDYNFDGYPDLVMRATKDRDDNSTYCIWLFNPATQRFELSDLLSSLSNPKPDPATKTVITHENQDCAGGCYEQDSYAWQKGEFVLVREEWQTEDPTIAPTHDCRFIRGGEKRKNGEMVQTGRIWVDVGGVMCQPHF